MTLSERWEPALFVGVPIAVGVALLVGAVWFFVQHENAQVEMIKQKWDGAMVVRICVSGTYIYRLEDGSYVTGGWGSARVENPDTVCEGRR